MLDIFHSQLHTNERILYRTHKPVLFEILNYACLMETKSPPSVVSDLPRHPTEWVHYWQQ